MTLEFVRRNSRTLLLVLAVVLMTSAPLTYSFLTTFSGSGFSLLVAILLLVLGVYLIRYLGKREQLLS